MSDAVLKVFGIVASALFMQLNNISDDWTSSNTLRLGTNQYANSELSPGGGYVDFLCKSDQTTKVFAECDLDCRLNHGSISGTCGNITEGDYSCYCGRPAFKRQPKSLHCAKITNGYRNICEKDCICNHAATGGVCDWIRHACVCTHQGQNRKNIGCEYKDWHSFFGYVHSQIGHEGFGVVDQRYHEFVNPN